jgi:hypothetical protein
LGDCAWYAIIEAGHLSVQFNAPQALKRHLLNHCVTNKQQICYKILTEFDDCNIPPLDRALRYAQLVCALDTDGEYAEFHHLQLAARVLQRSIHIHDVETHKVTSIHFPTWAKPILLAYRMHQMFWSYDKLFRPIDLLHGHYWAILPNRRWRSTRQPLLPRLGDFNDHTAALPRRHTRVTSRSSQDAPLLPPAGDSGLQMELIAMQMCLLHSQIRISLISNLHLTYSNTGFLSIAPTGPEPSLTSFTFQWISY